jgi:regulator of sigma E protease
MVDGVAAGSPAEVAGLQSGDVFLQINDQMIMNTTTLVSTIHDRAGTALDLVVLRDGERLELQATPRQVGEYDAEKEGPLGIGLAEGPVIRRNPFEAASGSLQFMWEYISLYGRLPSMLINGEITAQEARPVSIVGISQIAGEAAESSASGRTLYPLLIMASFISIALGLTNLLPIPALDGGRILFVLIEAVRGRRIEPEREGMVHVIGMIVLLALMAVLIVQDIINPIIPIQ